MADTSTVKKTEKTLNPDTPWSVIIHDDPVNLMDYVTHVIMKIFNYKKKTADKMMMEIHQSGSSTVWTGDLEKAEFYAQQLQFHQLKTSLEKVE